MKGTSLATYVVGAGVAFKAVDRLMLRAYSRTLVFASIMENALDAAVDLHRTMVAVFGAALAAGNAILGLFLEEEIVLELVGK